jgi:hypothetical protein
MSTGNLRILLPAVFVFMSYSDCCISKPKAPKIKVYKAIVSTNLQKKKMKGILREATDSSIIILSDDRPIEIPSAAIEKLIIKRKGNVGRGAIIGVASGAALGFIAGYVDGDETCVPSSFGGIPIACDPTTAAEKAVAGAIIFGLTGAVIGTIVGSVMKAEKIRINGSQSTFHNNISRIKQCTLSRP